MDGVSGSGASEKGQDKDVGFSAVRKLVTLAVDLWQIPLALELWKTTIRLLSENPLASSIAWHRLKFLGSF